MKCTIILPKGLPAGLQANASAILGITIGKKLPHIVGEDVYTTDGKCHAGITEYPVPVLCQTPEALTEIYEKAKQDKRLTVIGFPRLARKCRTYPAFIEKMGAAQDIIYDGIAIFGEDSLVSHITGSLPLLR